MKIILIGNSGIGTAFERHALACNSAQVIVVGERSAPPEPKLKKLSVADLLPAKDEKPKNQNKFFVPARILNKRR